MKSHVTLFVLLVLVVTIILSVPQESASQTQSVSESCGSIVTPEGAAFERNTFQNLLESTPRGARLGTPFHFPITVHIVRRSDGTGGMRLGQVDTAMVDLNAQFAQLNWQFFVFGAIDYIDDDSFFSGIDSTDFDALRMTNPVVKTINLYFVDLAGTGYCGISTFTYVAIQGILVDPDCAGVPTDNSTLAHEVGHYFNLSHTHETIFGVECPSGINCAVAGDLCCDTPADPNLLNHVLSNTICWYDQFAAEPTIPPCDNAAYAPSTNNIMSYSLPLCKNAFTTCQLDRMYVTATVVRLAELYERVVFVDGAYIGPENGLPWSPYNTVAEGIAAADAGDVVFIEPGTYSEYFSVSKNLIFRNWDKGAGSVIIGN